MYSVSITDCQTITIYYKLSDRRKDKKIIQYVEVAISSKILKSNNHEGINSQNIHSVYDHLLAQNYLTNVSLEEFFQFELEDVDIKQDTEINLTDYKLFMNHLPNSIINTNNQKKWQPWNNKTSAGLEINRRSLSTVNSKQYLKFYFKSLEMNHSKNNFFDKYYNIEASPKNIARLEATIPNEKQFQKYHPSQPFNLNTLLNFKEEQYQIIFTKIFSYLLRQNKTTVTMEEEKLEKSVSAKFIREQLNFPTKANRLDSIEQNYLNLLDKYDTWYPNREDRTKKHRLRKTTKLVYQSMIREAKNYIILKKQMQKSLEDSYKKTFRNYNIKP
jgi:hypothetical protein